MQQGQRLRQQGCVSKAHPQCDQQGLAPPNSALAQASPAQIAQQLQHSLRHKLGHSGAFVRRRQACIGGLRGKGQKGRQPCYFCVCSACVGWCWCVWGVGGGDGGVGKGGPRPRWSRCRSGCVNQDTWFPPVRVLGGVRCPGSLRTCAQRRNLAQGRAGCPQAGAASGSTGPRHRQAAEAGGSASCPGGEVHEQAACLVQLARGTPSPQLALAASPG